MTHLTTAQVATAARQRLADRYPDTAWSVRTRDRLCVLLVAWEDGPAEGDVAQLLAPLFHDGPPVTVRRRGGDLTGWSPVTAVDYRRGFSDDVLGRARAAWADLTGKNPDQVRDDATFGWLDLGYREVRPGLVAAQLQALAAILLEEDERACEGLEEDSAAEA